MNPLEKESASTITRAFRDDLPSQVVTSRSAQRSHAVSDRYMPRKILGRGGMGEVRLVIDGVIGRDVAFKVLDAEMSKSSDARDRFFREVRVQGRLEHPSIVPVYDAGYDPDGNCFFTMKRISGQTLEEILVALKHGEETARSAWTVTKLLGVFRHVCLAVDYAHSRGVVHRDLKPANVMVGSFGEVYVLDWGVAKILGEPEALHVDGRVSLQTLSGEVLGTPGYMAPEQIGNAAEADERCDVYSLGAILFEMLTHDRLHGGGTMSKVLASTQNGADARARTRAPARDVAPELEAVCVRATSTDPGVRFPTVRELTVAVERYAEGDRDLELRRRMALQHTEAAEAAAAKALAGGNKSHRERERALGEAGRALALDPNATGALSTVVKLLAVPPEETPPEVVRVTQEEEDHVLLLAVRGGAYVYGGFLVICGSLFWLGVDSWQGLVSILVPLAMALAGCLYVVRTGIQTDMAGRLQLPILFSAYTAVAAASGIAGGMVLVPTLAIALAAGGGLWLHSRTHRLMNIVGGGAAMVGPLLLEWAGWLPRSYVFKDGAITVLPVITRLPEIPARVAMIFASVGALVCVTLFVYYVTDLLRGIRLRLAVQSWQLRRLTAVRER